jgi:ABC-type iron transport system FetAB ATPase subunit
VPSDATQDQAVAFARSGRSYIIQGPPGTGKSQTITNLIADLAGQGKRVLFVCEKRAALDVVFHRLGQAGLDGLATIIHDSQDDKKGFIADLRDHYERWGRTADGLDDAQSARAQTVAALEEHLRQITAFETAVGQAAADGQSGAS